MNPFSGERIPIWVGNFVLMGYGTGAIMSVPAHDQRDFEFARKYGIEVRVVIEPEGEALDGATLAAAYDGTGKTVRTGEWSGLDSREAIQRMTAAAERGGFGRGVVTYRLKDWLISRQRYWGTPIPVVYCETDGVVPVPESDLPVVLPADAPFTGEGGNPLDKVPSFVHALCPKCGGSARRETDTMDTFVDSSWYFYRYLSPKKTDGAVDDAAVRYWFPIDLYVGGIEHAILHLVYSRFWTKVMKDIGLVSFDEPVVRLFPQGMVHKDGEVMSKSKGNTVSPDDMVSRYGADTLRLYILFVAPPEDPLEWSDKNVSGAHRFLQRVWRLVDRHAEALAQLPRSNGTAEITAVERELRRRLHQTVLRVTHDIEDRMRFNTAVAALMELLNDIERLEAEVTREGPSHVWREVLETLVLLLNPFAPHVSEEMAVRLAMPAAAAEGGLVRAPWPVADTEAARDDVVELAVQVNGRVRGRIRVASEAPEEDVKTAALSDPKVVEHLAGKSIVKVVVVAGRLVSVVVK